MCTSTIAWHFVRNLYHCISLIDFLTSNIKTYGNIRQYWFFTDKVINIYTPCAWCCSHDRRPPLWATLACKIWPDLQSVVFLCFEWPLKGRTTCTRRQGQGSFHEETPLEASQPEIYSSIHARSFDQLNLYV